MFKKGQIIGGKYVIERLLGEGGMGAIFVAHHDVLGRMVAIKVLHPEHARSTEMAKRFIQEAKAASLIRHEHIVDVMDIDETEDGLLYIVMELLEGESLAQRLHRTGRVPVPKAAEICGQILLALRKAHAEGIIHRDIKPENVFLTTLAGRRDFVKILDFGISKLAGPFSIGADKMGLTRTGMMIGTPSYMSPEQARGEKVDHRIDIYATGVILYELVTGALPYDATNVQALAFKVATKEPVPPRVAFPEIPPMIEAVILKAIARDPDQRFYSAAEFFVRLKPFGARDYSEKKDSAEDWIIPPEGGSSGAAVPETSSDETSASSLRSPPSTPMHAAKEALSPKHPFSSAILLEKPKRRSRLPVIAGAVAIAAIIAASAVLLVQELPGKNGKKETKQSIQGWLPAGKTGKKGKVPPVEPQKKSFSLRIKADPPTAAIRLDGTLLQGNPAEIKVFSGEDHLVTAQAEGFITRETKINLTQDRDVSFDLVPSNEASPSKEKSEVKKGKKGKKEAAGQKAKKKIISDEWDSIEKTAGSGGKPQPGKKTIKDTWDDLESAPGAGSKSN